MPNFELAAQDVDPLAMRERSERLSALVDCLETLNVETGVTSVNVVSFLGVAEGVHWSGRLEWAPRSGRRSGSAV